ncbi:MAG: RNA polymerase sigma-70 factor [Tannerellaceae bacterium]|nr:RNA polymerase sigma-70 factor [Tannerellaceae bacterium]MCD8264415.1 RNA polymerase sigma-70 factor [Tannerellaceae bacterium]
MLNDLLLLNKIKEGNIKAFEQLFRFYYSPLCLYAAGITGRMEIAEEIVQELFYTLWKEREKIQIFHSIKSYLYGAVRNQSLQYCEHRKIRNRYQEKILNNPLKEVPATDPQSRMEYEELKLINNTLNKLPERRNRIFRMHRFEGKKYNEIAAILAVSIKTVEAEMTKALQTLRKEIEHYTYLS